MVLELIAIAALQGEPARITSYRSVPEQTDSTPNWTSTGEHVAPGGCAVSRDLLHGGVPYGTWLYIDGFGLCRVNDTTHPRLRRTVDLWVATHAEEKRVGVRTLKVYIVPVKRKS